MSRSFKKTPGMTDNVWSAQAKRHANRKFRRISVNYEIANGNAYRKYSCSWDICDWKFLYFSKQEFNEFVNDWINIPGYEVKRWHYERK